MEYNLVHALIGRFGVLIPLLGLFFELGGIISRKRVISNIAGAIVILGCFLGILSGFTGFLEIKYLMSMNEAYHIYKIHYLIGGIISLLFTIILFIRIYLYYKISEKIIIFYFLIYTITILGNLYSNEIIIHILKGG